MREEELVSGPDVVRERLEGLAVLNSEAASAWADDFHGADRCRLRMDGHADGGQGLEHGTVLAPQAIDVPAPEVVVRPARIAQPDQAVIGVAEGPSALGRPPQEIVEFGEGREARTGVRVR